MISDSILTAIPKPGCKKRAVAMHPKSPAEALRLQSALKTWLWWRSYALICPAARRSRKFSWGGYEQANDSPRKKIPSSHWVCIPAPAIAPHFSYANLPWYAEV